MDSYDWVNWIDEFHCPDYWYDISELEREGYDPDFDDDDLPDDDCGHLVGC